MKNLHGMYNDGHPKDTRYRSKLKRRLINEFGERICFLRSNNKTPEMVKMSNGSLEHLNDSFDKQSIVTEAAKILREDILQYAENINTDHWPPNLALLKDLFESIPATVFDFLETLLKEPAHGLSECVKRLIKSYACDMVHGVTLGKVVTLKHYLLGLGFHNMSGQKLLIKILSLFGHTVSYDTVTMAETSLAEISQLQSESGTSSGLQPKERGD